MLYPTHMRTAITFGTIGASVALIEHEPALSAITIVGGAIVGGRLPDCDSPSSIPSKRYPWLSSIERALGIKHRGHISHGWVFNTILWLGIWYLLSQMKDESAGFLIAVITIAFSLNQFYHFLYQYILSIPSNPTHFLPYLFLDSDRLTNSKTKENYYPKMRPLNKPFTLGICAILSVMIAFLFKNDATKIGVDYFLGIWVGVLSHLFADSITKQGTEINGRTFHILGPLSNHIKTGTGIELWFRSFFTITSGLGIVIATALMLMELTHGI